MIERQFDGIYFCTPFSAESEDNVRDADEFCDALRNGALLVDVYNIRAFYIREEHDGLGILAYWCDDDDDDVRVSLFIPYKYRYMQSIFEHLFTSQIVEEVAYHRFSCLINICRLGDDEWIIDEIYPLNKSYRYVLRSLDVAAYLTSFALSEGCIACQTT